MSHQTLLGKRLVEPGQLPDGTNLLTRLIEQRGLQNAPLTPSLSELEDYSILNDIEVAAQRIIESQEGNERVMIFGDYDVDGVSSTAALFLFLRDELDIQVSYRIPSREQGYGLSPDFVDEISKTGTTLLITVDCGIRDFDACKKAADIGLDLIITDHHGLAESLPEGPLAIVNPEIPPHMHERHISGAGVVFKLIHALSDALGLDTEHMLTKYSDLIALGTVADCMPLVGDNRIIVQKGLRQMKISERPCFQLLRKEREITTFTSETIGYLIGPLLNAAGRVAHPYAALQFLIGDTSAVHKAYAQLVSCNEKRKSLTKHFTEKATQSIEATGEKNAGIHLFFDPELPHGISGIIAGKICETYNKPAIALAPHGDDGKHLVASCRSPEYCDISSCLEACADLLVRHGGHAGAAGFTIETDKLEVFTDRMNHVIKEATSGVDTTPLITPDFSLSLTQVTLENIEAIDALAPFGMGNEQPLVYLPDVMLEDVRIIGQTKEHIKLQATQRDTTLDVIGFGFAPHYDVITSAGKVGLLGHMTINEWQGSKKPQIQLVDVHKH